MTTVIGPFKGEYAWLSNMYPCYITLPGSRVEWSCTETPYQRAKFTDRTIRDMFHGLNGYEAKKLARRYSGDVRPDWNDIRLHVMTTLVATKFSNQSPHTQTLCNQLLNTGDSDIVEINTWGDTYWGVCRGVGENNLGRILMARRQSLRECEAL